MDRDDLAGRLRGRVAPLDPPDPPLPAVAEGSAGRVMARAGLGRRVGPADRASSGGRSLVGAGPNFADDLVRRGSAAPDHPAGAMEGAGCPTAIHADRSRAGP